MPFKWSTGYLLGNTIDFSCAALTLRISTQKNKTPSVNPAGEIPPQRPQSLMRSIDAEDKHAEEQDSKRQPCE